MADHPESPQQTNVFILAPTTTEGPSRRSTYVDNRVPYQMQCPSRDGLTVAILPVSSEKPVLMPDTREIDSSTSSAGGYGYQKPGDCNALNRYWECSWSNELGPNCRRCTSRNGHTEPSNKKSNKSA